MKDPLCQAFLNGKFAIVINISCILILFYPECFLFSTYLLTILCHLLLISGNVLHVAPDQTWKGLQRLKHQWKPYHNEWKCHANLWGITFSELPHHALWQWLYSSVDVLWHKGEPFLLRNKWQQNQSRMPVTSEVSLEPSKLSIKAEWKTLQRKS